jgi:phenylpropionate dioxygenase-like ring-hydroxylating dioxygenase large terminal subunit
MCSNLSDVVCSAKLVAFHELHDLCHRIQSLTIFQSWLYLAHVTQFSKAGAYQSFDIAGFPVFLIRGKDSEIRAVGLFCLMMS